MPALQHFRAPEGLAPGPGYSHAVTGRGRWVATAGQVALDDAGQLVGPGDPEAQTRQVFANLSRALAAAGASFADVIKLNYYTLANVITVAAPIAADWNDSHIFNQRWPGHARFHGVTALAMATTLSAANVWSVWADTGDRATARFFAAAVPVAYWAPFFLAPLVPGTTLEDAPHPVPRLAGMPTNVLGAAATTATAVAGWFIDRRTASSPAS